MSDKDNEAEFHYEVRGQELEIYVGGWYLSSVELEDISDEARGELNLKGGDGSKTRNIVAVSESYEDRFINGRVFSTNIWNNCEYIKETKKVPYGPGEMPDLLGKTLIRKDNGNGVMAVEYSHEGSKQINVHGYWYTNLEIFEKFEHGDGSAIGKDEGV